MTPRIFHYARKLIRRRLLPKYPHPPRLDRPPAPGRAGAVSEQRTANGAMRRGSSRQPHLRGGWCIAPCGITQQSSSRRPSHRPFFSSVAARRNHSIARTTATRGPTTQILFTSADTQMAVIAAHAVSAAKAAIRRSWSSSAPCPRLLGNGAGHGRSATEHMLTRLSEYTRQRHARAVSGARVVVTCT